MAGVASTAQASDIQMDYMKLLVTQLQNQNPLEPLDNQEMASQLAQFSQLEQLETMNSSFSGVLEYVERTYASSLIGKEISFQVDTGTGTVGTESGTVEEVGIAGEEVILKVGSHTVRLEDVVTVKD